LRVLLIGRGGREHALARSLHKSGLVKELFCNTFNPGINQLATFIGLESAGLSELARWAKDNAIDLTVVGPEAPLSLGIVDEFNRLGLAIFGPTKQAARIESSKAYAKDLMKRYGIPTAEYVVCDDYRHAVEQVERLGAPIVVKADGLAAGKGVMVCRTVNEAKGAIEQMLSRRIFGEAGNKVILEEYLEGEEVSILAFCDGTNILPMVPSQDHKAIYDGDLGPNTGGMGAYSPVPIIKDRLMEVINKTILQPVIKAMAEEGHPYKGVLYAGLMITAQGPKVIEFNCRFGDPETQCVVPRLKSDLVQVMLACVNGKLSETELVWDERCCVCVVLTSGGYPGAYKTGYPIMGIEDLNNDKDIMVFQAGTKKVRGQILTDGGRVLNVCALAPSIEEAVNKAYKAVGKISFQDMYYRTDIAYRALTKK
jgi:phosphoribosylamine--glycine ligase